MNRIPTFLAIVVIGATLAVAARSDSPPDGRFYREYWYEVGPGHGNMVTRGRFRVNAPEAVLHPSFGKRSETRSSGMLQILMEEDLSLLDGAELYTELWGGHPHTRAKRVTLNGRNTYAIAEVGTADGHCTHQYPAIPLDVTDLVNGYNAVQFACDQGSSFWGHFIVDNAALRGVLKRNHPDLVKAGLAEFTAAVTVREVAGNEALQAELTVPRLSEAIRSVEFQGYYDGYDENGDTMTRDWHGFTKRRQPVAVLGVAGRAPLRVVWDTSMLPDQEEVRVRAIVRFREQASLVYESAASAPVHLPARNHARVRQFVCTALPKPFVSRVNRLLKCSIPIDVDPRSVERAELHTVAWDGGRGTVADYFTLNGRPMPVAGEGRHDVIYTRLSIDPGLLKRGDNQVKLRSDTEHHGIEILRPGPALIVRYRK
jgi:hypothetical protein